MEQLVQVTLPLHTHFNKPDANGRIFSKETYEKAIKDPRFDELGGIPVTLGPTSTDINLMCLVDPRNVVGYANNVDIDKMVAQVKLNGHGPGVEVSKMIEEGWNLSLGIRAIGKAKSISNYDIEKIISFEIIDSRNNPCETVITNEEIVGQLKQQLKDACKEHTFDFSKAEENTDHIVDELNKAVMESAKIWNENHPNKTVNIVFANGHVERHILNGQLIVTGDGTEDFINALNN